MTEDNQPEVVDVQKEIALHGRVFDLGNGVLVGPNNATLTPGLTMNDTRKPWEKSPRRLETYHGEQPIVDGKLQTQFLLSRKCGIKGADGKECTQRLVGRVVKNYEFQWNEYRTGGQLNYTDEQKIFVLCPLHGPDHIPSHWKPNTDDYLV